MRRTLLLAVTAAAVAAAAPAATASSCSGGITGPAKPIVHSLEKPVEGTPAADAIHTVECNLP
ncbi:MAG: hypothetical protein WD794_04495 [Mycobacteriales bacterium]